MVKVRRNRQPKPYHLMTGVRTHTGIIRSVQENRVKVTALEPEKQKKKLEEKEKKLARQILRKKEELYSSTTSIERKAALEILLPKLEMQRTRAIFNRLKVEDKQIDYKLREQTAKNNLAEQMRIAKEKHKEATERIVRERKEALTIRSSNEVEDTNPNWSKSRIGQGRMKTYIVKSPKGSRKVKRKWTDKS